MIKDIAENKSAGVVNVNASIGYKIKYFLYF
jgi:hypothetical protein